MWRAWGVWEQTLQADAATLWRDVLTAEERRALAETLRPRHTESLVACDVAREEEAPMWPYLHVPLKDTLPMPSATAAAALPGEEEEALFEEGGQEEEDDPMLVYSLQVCQMAGDQGSALAGLNGKGTNQQQQQQQRKTKKRKKSSSLLRLAKLRREVEDDEAEVLRWRADGMQGVPCVPGVLEETEARRETDKVQRVREALLRRANEVEEERRMRVAKADVAVVK